MAPRKLFVRCPFDETLRQYQDLDWLLRVASMPGLAVQRVEKPLTLLHQRRGGKSISGQYDWQGLLVWAKEKHALFTPKAYAGLVMGSIADQALKKRERRALKILWNEAFRNGVPGFFLPIVYLYKWLVPERFRHAVREGREFLGKGDKNRSQKFLERLLKMITRALEITAKSVAALRERERKRVSRGPGKIAVLYMASYFHDYLEEALKADDAFVLRHSRHFVNERKDILFFDPKDPETNDVVVPETTRFWKEGFTGRHRVLLRIQHSPGFSFRAPFEPYEDARRIGGRLMIPRKIWELAQREDFCDPKTKRLIDVMRGSREPVFLTDYDFKMNALFRLPVCAAREQGTVLAALNWRAFFAPDDTDRALEALGFFVRFAMKVRVLWHPLSRFFLKKNIDRIERRILKAGAEVLEPLQSTESLCDLYDRHEFILTDGSGSAYEGIARGCKALRIDGMDFHKPGGVLFPAISMGLLPRTRFVDFKEHVGATEEQKWLKTLFPESLVKESVASHVAREIREAFAGWDGPGHIRGKNRGF